MKFVTHQVDREIKLLLVELCEIDRIHEDT